jgi:hypothetical protein
VYAVFQVNSLWGSVHGIWDFASGRWGIKHCSATKCARIVNSIHYGIDSRDLVLASGCPASKHCSALKCTHSLDSTAYAVSGQPSAAYFWSLFLGLDQVRTARPSRGSQIAIRHLGEHTMLGNSTAYAVDSCSWFKLVRKRCSKNWVGYQECRTSPLGVRGAHNAQLSNAYAVWFKLV